ncbi:MAG: hypothetical protein V4540_15905 [Pseudomonadota bacterium]
MSFPSGIDEAATAEPVDRVEATVFACVMVFELVFARTASNYQYVLTPQTSGISLEDLREGQRLSCLVTRRMPRVLAAQILE